MENYLIIQNRKTEEEKELEYKKYSSFPCHLFRWWRVDKSDPDFESLNLKISLPTYGKERG